jgi:hypothetical protein
MQRRAFYYVKDRWRLAGKIRSFFTIAELGPGALETGNSKIEPRQVGPGAGRLLPRVRFRGTKRSHL